MSTNTLPALPAIPALPSRDDSDVRFSLLDLDTPRAAPVPSAEETCTVDALVTFVNAAQSFAEMREIAADFNSGKSLRAIYFRTLGKDVADSVRQAWRARTGQIISEVWSALWAPVATAISTPTRSPESIEASLLGIRNEIPRATRQETRRSNRAETTAIREAQRANTLVVTSLVNALAQGQGARLSWERASGKGLIKRGDIVARLDTLGLSELAPASPSAVRQLGEAVKTIGHRAGIVTTSADKGSRGPGNAALWTIGQVDFRADLGSLGEKQLIVELRTDGTLRTLGSESLGARVRSEYERRLAGETYSATAALDWLLGRLRSRYNVASIRGGLYVPAGHVASVRAIVDGLAEVIGRDIGLEGLADVRDVAGSIARGLAREADALTERYAVDTDKARSEHREGIGARAAVTLLADIEELRGRVTGYRPVIGQEADRILATLASLDERARERLDDGALRASNLELD